MTLPRLLLWTPLAAGAAAACDSEPDDPIGGRHGPIAPDIMAPMGEPVPYADAEERASFARGSGVATHRFTRSEGLGPTFNATFCAGCHERPTIGGAAGSYRNFMIAGVERDGAFFFADDDILGERYDSVRDGVVRLYHYAEDEFYYGHPDTARPELPDDIDVATHRNPIPMFGVGLLAQVPDEDILSRADPDDDSGDGISGRPNFEDGLVGRFGRKAQTASLVGFVRGPLFNHLGISTNPLTEEELAALPVDSSGGPEADDVDMTPCEEREDLGREVGGEESARSLWPSLERRGQAAAPAGPLCSDDDIPDPQMTNQELFDLVSFTMLLAAPRFEPLTAEGERGQEIFDDIGCEACHTPRLDSPRGPIPAYTDLLLHDMGEGHSDGLSEGEAGPTEFRTQPLWGIAATSPYLHDGRAHTLEEAILYHGGEAQPARDAFAELAPSEQDALVEFLLSLGGRDQYTPGLVPPHEPIPEPGEYGGPARELSPEELERFARGREAYDTEFGLSDGLGDPHFNGDSCRACHFEPVIGGSGPRGVNVIRHGFLGEDGSFVEPEEGSILPRVSSLTDHLIAPDGRTEVFELRQTPHTFGLGLVDDIPDEVILARADPDGEMLPGEVRGRAPVLDDGRLGRFGWKAQVPSLAEFVRDAASEELGFTVPEDDELTFGNPAADPELSAQQAEDLDTFMRLLAPPPRQDPPFPAMAARGEELFEDVGCVHCHVPELRTEDGRRVELYSDLLLHEVLPEGAVGIEQGAAGMREFRTAPLWGLSQTAPYMHSGQADTIDEAIRLHAGTAASIRDAYLALPAEEQDALLAFLRTL